MRIAAVGDIHVGIEADGRLAASFAEVHEHADVLLLAGDLTKYGLPEEAENVVRELASVRVPIAAVLGNHDYHSGNEREVAAILSGAGVCVLDGTAIVLEIGGKRLGVAGVKGFGGGPGRPRHRVRRARDEGVRGAHTPDQPPPGRRAAATAR